MPTPWTGLTFCGPRETSLIPAFEIPGHRIVFERFSSGRPYSRNTVDFLDSSRLDDFWRLKLEAAQRRYSADPNAETRAEFPRLQRLFADLVNETSRCCPGYKTSQAYASGS
jgi:hypothetical protein